MCQTVWIQIRPYFFIGHDLGRNCLEMLSVSNNLYASGIEDPEGILFLVCVDALFV